MNKKTIIGIVIVVAVAALVFAFWPRAKATVAGTPLNCATNTTCLPSLELTGNQDTSTPSLQVDTTFYSVGGVTTTYARSALATATTTVCALQSPNATTTLEGAPEITLLTSSTTASVVTIAEATNAFATTTSIGSAAVGANAQATITASSTATLGKNVISPQNWIVVGMQGGTGTFSPTGGCVAAFRSVL